MKAMATIVSESIWRHLNEVNSAQYTIEHNLVLLDSGSNEVVVPFNGKEWQQIVDKNHILKRTEVGLALNQSMEAGITMGGG